MFWMLHVAPDANLDINWLVAVFDCVRRMARGLAPKPNVFVWNYSSWYLIPTMKLVFFNFYSSFFAVKTCPKLPVPYYGMATCKNEDLNLFFDYSPRNGTFMESYNDDELRITEPMPIDTDCNFKCGPGFTMTGSTTRNCLPLSKWDGIQTGCKREKWILSICTVQETTLSILNFPIEILCSALPPVNFGQYDPTDCTDQKLAHGTNCTLICNSGFEVKGPSSKMCGGRKTGIWSNRNKQPKCVGKWSHTHLKRFV